LYFTRIKITINTGLKQRLGSGGKKKVQKRVLLKKIDFIYTHKTQSFLILTACQKREPFYFKMGGKPQPAAKGMAGFRNSIFLCAIE
jgi:hypothetical protein